jgi:hypothetical protein
LIGTCIYGCKKQNLLPNYTFDEYIDAQKIAKLIKDEDQGDAVNRFSGDCLIDTSNKEERFTMPHERKLLPRIKP